MSPAIVPTKRNPVIDLMRVMGLGLIVLAHVAGVPQGVFTLRSFDVVMMVFISGLAYAGRPVAGGLAGFYAKRTLRLLVPVWVYLCAYYLVFHGMYSPRVMLDGFLLGQRMAYVWIIRVFLLMMLLVPLHSWLGRTKKRLAAGAALWLVLFAGQWWLVCQGVAAGNTFVRDWVYYAVGYGAVLFADMRVRRLPGWAVAVAGGHMLLAAAGVAIHEGVFNPQLSKYPPHGEYLLYGTGMSCLAWWVLGTAPFVRCRRLLAGTLPRVARGVQFAAKHTIWIYLHHIALATLATGWIPGRFWLPAYGAVCAASFSIVYLQVAVVQRLQARCNHPLARKCLGYFSN